MNIPIRPLRSLLLVLCALVFPNWQQDVSSGLDRVVDWSARLKKPAVITEWGAYTSTMDRAEWITYTRYFHDQLKQRGIGSMYYTAFFANDWAWSIYDSEWGWDQAALDILTGVKSPAIPPTIHDGDDLADLRLTVRFIGSDNTVYFDRVALKSTRNE